MRAFCLVVLFAVLCLRVVTYAAADRAEPRYLGAWTVTAAVDAPWAVRAADAAERTRLLGKAVVLRTEEIEGPPALACPAPRYELRDLAAAEIVEKFLAHMRPGAGTADAQAVAVALGLAGPRVKTLETGCGLAIHFVDVSTARIARDDIVYTLKRR